MELVHSHAAYIRLGTFAQSLVGQNFCRATDDGRLRVDMRVTRNHAYVVSAKHLYQVKELLRDKRFDGSGVVAALALCHAHKEHAQCHE